jgi:hypothetical protein
MQTVYGIKCKRDALKASLPQIYSNNKKGRESDESDSKKL